MLSLPLDQVTRSVSSKLFPHGTSAEILGSLDSAHDLSRCPPLKVLWYRPAFLFLPHKPVWGKGAAVRREVGRMVWYGYDWYSKDPAAQ